MHTKLAPLLLALLHCNFLVLGQAGQVTYIKNGQVYDSNTEGTEIRQLTTGAAPKRMPKWSPDGKKIAYLEPAAISTSVGTLVVIGPDGSLVGRYPVATATSRGVPIVGMRDIELIGWFDNEDVFAVGSINPYIDEYRAINLRSGNAQSFGGFGFATCPAAGIVAYWQAVYPQQKAMNLMTSAGREPLFQFPNSNELPTLHVPLAWDESCKSIALVDPAPPAHLIVISVVNRERQVVELPDVTGTVPVRPVRGGFLLGAEWQFFYEVRATRIERTPPDLAQRLQNKLETHRRTIQALGGSDADWWPEDLAR